MRVRVSPSAPFLTRTICLALYVLATVPAVAWDANGHAAVGVLAVAQLEPATHSRLEVLMGDLSPETVAADCNWADEYRKTRDGRWSAPLHYVNIDPGSNRYIRTRDCPKDACVVEAVGTFAARLGDPTLPVEARQEAFRFLCHFTGDLHQPLHVGYADDQGGNQVTVYFQGERVSLHVFWDHSLPTARTTGWQGLVETLSERPNPEARGWNEGERVAWTNETFSLTRNFAYPPTRRIDEAFADRSWQVALQQLDMAAERLALILDTELAE